jgi:hypothetical protein
MSKRNRQYNRPAPYEIALSMLLIYFGSHIGSSQSIATAIEEKPPPPKEEIFKASTDLVIPWRDGDCVSISINRRGSGCYLVTAAQYVSHTTLTLYKDDSSVWLKFDLESKNPGYFGRTNNASFVPFATPGLEGSPPSRIVLRVTGESEHWYRVIVNEDSGAVAYVLKGDPEWSKSTFEYWLKGWHLRPPLDHPPLLDAPNGKVIPESEPIHFEQVAFLKLDKPDGEWAFVERTVDSKTYRGWLRWRDGRKFLVDCYFAYKTLPKSRPYEP